MTTVQINTKNNEEMSSPQPYLLPLQDHTWVCILFRPLNHKIWPRLSSLSAWSISSTSSANSSSGISSFCVPWPASLRNFNWLVGIVDINYNNGKQKKPYLWKLSLTFKFPFRTSDRLSPLPKWLQIRNS